MIIKDATQIGNSIVRRRSKNAAARAGKPLSKHLKTLVRNLVDSMRYHHLVGMAAPQIGVNERVFVTEVRRTRTRELGEHDPVRVFVNPRIVARSKKQEAGYEGCGSVLFGGLFGEVSRAEEVTVTALDEKGERFVMRAGGLLARIIQHETDHLDGTLFIDRVTDTKKLSTREEYLKRLGITPKPRRRSGGRRS